MELKQAMKIIHPDTTFEALAEIRYYAGFKCKEAELDVVNEACEIVCEAAKYRIPMNPIVVKMTDDIKSGNGTWKQGIIIYKCRNCEQFMSRANKYCSYCGQRVN